jgi:hypothetical protein
MIRVYNLSTLAQHLIQSESTHLKADMQTIPIRSALISTCFFMLAAFTSGAAFSADLDVALTIKNHRFDPVELKVPANQRLRLTIHNQDNTPEEFESHALNREKIIPAGAKSVIYIGPLKSGRYEFYGEYNEATAKGAVIAE